MKSIFTLSFLALVLTVSANAQVNTRDPLQSAYNFCTAIPYTSVKQDCLDVVNASQFFDDNALSFCKTLISPSDQVSCLRESANSFYEPSLLDTCKSLVHTSYKQECFTAIKGKFARSASALNACSSIAFPSDKLECVKKILVGQPTAVVVPAHQALCNRREVRTILDNVMTDVRSGRFTSALRGLTDLSALIDICFR